MNIFKQFINSLFSPKEIAAFHSQGIGKTILYVFFLALLSVIPSLAYSSTALVNGLNAIQTSIENEIPDFSIENGELKSDHKKPIIINREDFTIVFDSTGTVNPQDLTNNSTNTVGLLKNHGYFIAGNQVQSIPYSMIDTFTRDDFLNMLSMVNSSIGIIIPIMCVISFIFTSGVKFIEVSVLAFIGLLLTKLLARDLRYRHLWRMAAYSFTLPTVFFIVMDALKTMVPNGGMIYWFVAVMILLLSIKEIPQQKHDL